MCLTVYARFDGLVVLATDTRWTRKYSDGSVEHQDRGGKLVSGPGGFVAEAASKAPAGGRGCDREPGRSGLRRPSEREHRSGWQA